MQPSSLAAVGIVDDQKRSRLYGLTDRYIYRKRQRIRTVRSELIRVFDSSFAVSVLLSDLFRLVPLVVENLRALRREKRSNPGVSHLIYVVVASCVGERWTVQPRYFTA